MLLASVVRVERRGSVGEKRDGEGTRMRSKGGHAAHSIELDHNTLGI